MCTVFYLNDLHLLSKNRDKEMMETEEVVVTDDILAVRTKGADYFSLGINKQGCAFVSTAVNSPEWTAAIERDEVENAKSIMAAETEGKEGPTWWLSRLLPKVKSVDEWLQYLKDAKIRWRGYNLLLVDRTKAVHVEAYDDQLHIVPLDSRYIVTNHFRHLSWGAQKRAEYENSFNRFDYAAEKLALIKNREELFDAVAPPAGADQKHIWRKDNFQTISSTVIDLEGGHLFRCFGAGQPFEVHGLKPQAQNRPHAG